MSLIACSTELLLLLIEFPESETDVCLSSSSLLFLLLEVTLNEDELNTDALSASDFLIPIRIVLITFYDVFAIAFLFIKDNVLSQCDCRHVCASAHVLLYFNVIFTYFTGL